MIETQKIDLLKKEEKLQNMFELKPKTKTETKPDPKPVEVPEKTFDEFVAEMFQVESDINIKEWVKATGLTEDEKLDLYAVYVAEVTKQQVATQLKNEFAITVMRNFGLLI